MAFPGMYRDCLRFQLQAHCCCNGACLLSVEVVPTLDQSQSEHSFVLHTWEKLPVTCKKLSDLSH